MADEDVAALRQVQMLAGELAERLAGLETLIQVLTTEVGRLQAGVTRVIEKRE